jgi:nucleoside-diphosphate-sugar epimerase
MNPRVIITGAGGYLGTILMQVFSAQGWEVLPWTQRSLTGYGAQGTRFVLGEDVPLSSLKGIRALIHCAYDYRPTGWDNAYRVNNTGTQKLFTAATAAKIPRLVFISTMSAFPGCVSIYGRIKLEVEEFCLSRGILCVRPGLLWSSHPGGMYQRLCNLAQRLPLLPLLGGGLQKLAFTHVEDLAFGLEKFCRGEEPSPSKAIVTAFPKLFFFEEIMKNLAFLSGNNPKFVHLPVTPILLGLHLMEFLRFPIPFKSDNLISLLHQDPHPEFSGQIYFREWPPSANLMDD